MNLSNDKELLKLIAYQYSIASSPIESYRAIHDLKLLTQKLERNHPVWLLSYDNYDDVMKDIVYTIVTNKSKNSCPKTVGENTDILFDKSFLGSSSTEFFSEI